MFAGLLVGAMLPYWFSAMTMKSVGKAALAMVEEVRRQFNTISGLMEGTARPDYVRCVEISTQARPALCAAPCVTAHPCYCTAGCNMHIVTQCMVLITTMMSASCASTLPPIDMSTVDAPVCHDCEANLRLQDADRFCQAGAGSCRAPA